MELLIAMAADGAAIASHAPPRPPHVPTGPLRDCDPAKLSPRRRRGTAGAPIDAAAAHRPTLPRCVRPRRAATAAAHPSGGARARRETSREGFPSIRSPTEEVGEVDARNDELRAPIMMTQAFHRSRTSDRANEPIVGRDSGSCYIRIMNIWEHLCTEPCQNQMRAPTTRSSVRSFAWGAGKPLLKTKVNVMSQLWLMRWLSRSIWTPRQCGTNGKLMKRATKKIMATLTEIRVGMNWRQKTGSVQN